MKRILHEIQSGEFAREWLLEAKAGKPVFNALTRQGEEHPLESVGRSLRTLMPWLSREQAGRPGARTDDRGSSPLAPLQLRAPLPSRRPGCFTVALTGWGWRLSVLLLVGGVAVALAAGCWRRWRSTSRSSAILAASIPDTRTWPRGRPADGRVVEVTCASPTRTASSAARSAWPSSCRSSTCTSTALPISGKVRAVRRKGSRVPGGVQRSTRPSPQRAVCVWISRRRPACASASCRSPG